MQNFSFQLKFQEGFLSSTVHKKALFFGQKKLIFSRVLRNSTTHFVHLSIGPSIRLSVCHTLLFFGFCGLWPYCSCPSDQVTSNTAPAHPHATGVAVYLALFYKNMLFFSEAQYSYFYTFLFQKGRIHGYPSRVRVGRGCI